MRGKKLLPMVEKSGYLYAIKFASSGLLSLDPFADICRPIESLELRENLNLSTLFPEELDCFCEKIQKNEDNSDSE